MSTLTIRIPDRLRNTLAARAKARGQTLPQMVREMMEGQLDAAERPTAGSLYDRSQDLCGSLTGAPADLARNKEHLAGYAVCKR